LITLALSLPESEDFVILIICRNILMDLYGQRAPGFLPPEKTGGGMKRTVYIAKLNPNPL
jgi:hypothetical protein